MQFLFYVTNYELDPNMRLGAYWPKLQDEIIWSPVDGRKLCSGKRTRTVRNSQVITVMGTTKLPSEPQEVCEKNGDTACGRRVSRERRTIETVTFRVPSEAVKMFLRVAL